MVSEHSRTDLPPSRATPPVAWAVLVAAAVFWISLKIVAGFHPADGFLLVLAPLLPFVTPCYPAAILFVSAGEALFARVAPSYAHYGLGMIPAMTALAWMGWKPSGFARLLPGPCSQAHVLGRAGPFLRPLFGWAAIAAGSCVLFRAMPVVASVMWAAFAFRVWRSMPASPAPKHGTAAAIASNLAPLLLGVAAAGAILELGARAVHEHNHPALGFWTLHPEHGIWLRAGGAGHLDIVLSEDRTKRVHFTISEQGFRGYAYPEKDSSEIRILMLGDSFIFGNTTPLEETIPKALERILNADMPAGRVTVVNAGVGGTGPWEHRIVLNERGWGVEPDIVMHGIFPLNDITDSMRVESLLPRAYYETLFVYANRRHPAIRLHLWLSEHSYAYDAARVYLLGTSGFTAWARHLRFLPAMVASNAVASEARNPNLETNLREWYPELEAGFGIMTDSIRQIALDCRENAVPYIPFVIPQLDDLSPERFRVVAMESDSYDAYERGKANRMTQEFLDNLGVPAVDIIGPLENFPEHDALYYALDGHFNSRGHRVVAEVLAHDLVSRFPEWFDPDEDQAAGLRD